LWVPYERDRNVASIFNCWVLFSMKDGYEEVLNAWWSGVIVAEPHLRDEVESLMRNKMFTTRLNVVV